MKSYDEFKEEMIAIFEKEFGVSNVYPKEAETIDVVTKTGHIVSLSLIQMYQSRFDVKDIIDNIRVVSSYYFTDLADYEKVKGDLTIKALPLAQVSERCVYEENNDIALVLYLNFINENGVISSCKLLNTILDKWNVTKEEAIFAAYKNMLEKNGPRLYQIDRFIMDPLNYNGIDLFSEEAFIDKDCPFGTCLSGIDKRNGASAIFIPEVRKRVYALIGTDYYIVFTSIHEAMVHPIESSVSAKDLKSILFDTIKETVLPGEFLSYSIYQYYHDEDAIRKATS